MIDAERLQGTLPPSERLPIDELARVMASEAMGYHTPAQIPMFYQLAEQAALCESWFCSALAATWTNRFYLHGASAEGLRTNVELGSSLELGDLLSNWQSILDVMQKSNGLKATNFFHDFAFLRGANPDIGRELRQQFQRVVDDDDDEKPTGFFARARANKLPPLSIIDPHFGIVRGEDANDDHPNVGGRPGLHDIRKGQALIASIIAALAENPDQWNRTLLIITYDESGGFFDHVVPPMTVDVRKDFRQLGFRVPSLVVGPYVRRGCNIKTQLEHVSVIRTIEAIFGRRKLGDRFVFENRFEDPEVNARIDATNDVLSCLDADALEGEPLPPPRLDPVKFSLRSWRDLPRQSFHPELRDASRSMPEEIRAQAEEPVLERVMEIAEELGAIEVVP
jgi:phospholipase C